MHASVCDVGDIHGLVHRQVLVSLGFQLGEDRAFPRFQPGRIDVKLDWMEFPSSAMLPLKLPHE